MNSRLKKWLNLQLLICILLVSPIAFSQGTSASLNGVVADPSGAVIPHTLVTARNDNTNLVQTVYSNSSGVYSIAPLPPGPYSITVDAAGFKKSVEKIILTVDQQATVNFHLQPGSQSQTVSVSAGETLINATSAEISNVVNQRTIAQLPLNGRDPSSLVLLSPGVTNILNTSAGYTQNTDSFPNEEGASANGGQQGSAFALLDGVPNMDFYLNLVAPFPNSDATQEFRAITNNFGAQYGFSPGAVISIETKSGTNAFHGGLFEFFRNGDLNASNWFTGIVNTLKQNQFGGFIGGPIKKDKLFFFANYQGTRQSLASGTNTTFTPTAAMLNGDFSAVPMTLGPPFATVNGKPNQVNPALLSPAAVAMAKTALPLGQVPSTGQVNYIGPVVDDSYNEGTARLDYTLSNSQRLFARSFIQQYNFPAGNINGNILAAQLAATGRYYNEVISDTWLPNPNFVNVISAAWIRLDVNSGNQVYTNTGQPFCLSKYINVADPPGCYVFNFNAGAFGTAAFEPNGNTRATWWLSDHITKTLGNHLFTAGVDLAHQSDNTTTDYAGQMQVSFNGYATGFALSDFLLGDVSSFFQGAYENSPMRGWQLGVYGQDQYKATPNLTLTAGLRWEPDIAPISVDSGAAFVPGEQSLRYPQAPTGLIYPGDPGLNSALRPSDYNYFEPRVGIAWQPIGPKTSLRAGFGIFVAPLPFSLYNEAVGVAPFSPFYSVYATASNPISFQNPWAGFAATGGKSPFPPFTQNTNIPPSQAVFLLPTTIYDSFSRNFRLPVTQSWTVSLEQQLTRDLAFHLAYVGSESYHQTVNVDLNPGIYANGGNRTTYPDFSTIFENKSIGTTSYNSLQAGIEQQLTHGLQFQSNFTWSRSIDIQSFNNSAFGSVGLPNPFNVHFNRGIASFNVPLVSITNFVYETPLLNGHNMALRQIAGGWEVSGIWTLQSGLPFGIQGGDGDNNSGAQQYGDRADYVLGQPYGVHRGSKAQWLAHYFNTSAFVPNTPGTFGDTGKNFLQGPGINTADIAFMKNWNFDQRYNLQFRWEMYNALNHPSFGQPDNNPTDSNFGQITTIGPIPPRIMQIAAKLTF